MQTDHSPVLNVSASACLYLRKSLKATEMGNAVPSESCRCSPFVSSLCCKSNCGPSFNLHVSLPNGSLNQTSQQEWPKHYLSLCE